MVAFVILLRNFNLPPGRVVQKSGKQDSKKVVNTCSCKYKIKGIWILVQRTTDSFLGYLHISYKNTEYLRSKFKVERSDFRSADNLRYSHYVSAFQCIVL